MAKFVWLRESAFPRTGPRLEKGKEHDAALYDPAVVNLWIWTGAAAWVEETPGLKPESKKGKAARHSGGR